MDEVVAALFCHPLYRPAFVGTDYIVHSTHTVTENPNAFLHIEYDLGERAKAQRKKVQLLAGKKQPIKLSD